MVDTDKLIRGKNGPIPIIGQSLFGTKNIRLSEYTKTAVDNTAEVITIKSISL